MSTNGLDLPALDRAICGEIYASDAAVRNLERLCQECGGRFAGSDDYCRAAEMVAAWWREIGLTNVHLEPFPFTAWERGSASLTLTAPRQRGTTRVWPSPMPRPAIWRLRSSTWASVWTPM